MFCGQSRRSASIDGIMVGSLSAALLSRSKARTSDGIAATHTTRSLKFGIDVAVLRGGMQDDDLESTRRLSLSGVATNHSQYNHPSSSQSVRSRHSEYSRYVLFESE